VTLKEHEETVVFVKVDAPSETDVDPTEPSYE